MSGTVGMDTIEFKLTFDNRITTMLAKALREIVDHLSAGRP